MQHLVASEVNVTGPARFDAVLPRPDPRAPYFGTQGLPEDMLRARLEFYADVAVLAVRQTDPAVRISDLDEKALYVRDPYTSMPGVRPFFSPPVARSTHAGSGRHSAQDVVVLTDQLQPDGRSDVGRAGRVAWTILRFGRRTTAPTRVRRRDPDSAGSATSSIQRIGRALRQLRGEAAAAPSGRDRRIVRRAGPRCTSTVGKWVRRTGVRSSPRSSSGGAATARSAICRS